MCTSLSQLVLVLTYLVVDVCHRSVIVVLVGIAWTCNISLVPRLLPSFLSHTVQKTKREPGQFDHVCDDILCMALCVVLVIELLPTHAVLALSESPC